MYNELIIPSVKNTTLYIRQKNRATRDSFVDWHFHDEMEFLVAHNNQRVVYVENHTYHMNAGDILFINRKVPHKTFTPIDSSAGMLQFKNPFVNDNPSPMPINPSLSNDCDTFLFENGTPEHQQLASYIHLISSEYNNKQTAYAEFIRGYLLEMTAYLCRLGILHNPHEQPNIQPILPAIEYIYAHYTEPLSLKDVSRVMNIDKSHFCRLFKKYTGMTFVEHLNAVRIHEAEKLLSNTDISITDIAYAVGFSSTAYFIKIFGRYNACTPRKYRKMSTKKRED